MFTSFLTTGETITTAGKAIVNANDHDLSQIYKMLFTNPTLKMLMTSDIRQDIKSAIKNANTIC